MISRMHCRTTALPHSSRRATRNYLLLTGIAFVLTLSCPNTKLWKNACTNGQPAAISNQGQNHTGTSDIYAAQNTNQRSNVTDNTANTATSISFFVRARVFHRYYCCHDDSYDTISIHATILAKLIIVTTLALCSYFLVHKSNPGWLSVELMEQLKVNEQLEDKCWFHHDTKNNNSNDLNLNTDQEDDGECKTNNNQNFHREELTMEELRLLSDREEERKFHKVPQLLLELSPLSSLEMSETRTMRAEPTATPSTKFHSSSPILPSHQTLYPHTRRKYCNQCEIHPPLRSHHCKICNACVATFDHHCLFLDTCIGERNHCRFWFFLLMNVIAFNIALEIVNSSNPVSINVTSNTFGIECNDISGDDESSHPMDNGVNVSFSSDQDLPSLHWWGIGMLFLSRLYLYPLMIIGTLLLVIHTGLAVGNSTTFELGRGVKHVDYLKGTQMMDFPFSVGLWGNLKIFFCRDDVSKSFTSLDNDERRRVAQKSHVEAKKSLENNDIPCELKSDQNCHGESKFQMWVPLLWRLPDHIERNSEDWWRHPWQNKYWSCC